MDDSDNKHVTLTAEQIAELVQQAISTGELPDELAAFIDEIKEQNKGASLKFWVGTQAEFLALESTSADTIYFITDNTNLKDLDDALNDLVDQLTDGTFIPAKAAEVTGKISGKNISDIFETDGKTVKEATNTEYINSIRIEKDDEGILYNTETITVVIGGELSSSSGRSLYEISGDELSEGLKLLYKGEVAQVMDNGNEIFELSCDSSGPFATDKPSSVEALINVIPQKKLIWGGSQACTEASPATFNFSETIERSTEIEICGKIANDDTCYKFRAGVAISNVANSTNAYASFNGTSSAASQFQIYALGTRAFHSVTGTNNQQYDSVTLRGVICVNVGSVGGTTFTNPTFTVEKIYKIID